MAVSKDHPTRDHRFKAAKYNLLQLKVAVSKDHPRGRYKVLQLKDGSV